MPWMALLLGAVGLDAIVSQSILQRRKEIGIRIALGAGAANVICNNMRQGIVLASTGVRIGLAGALLTRLLRAMRFGVATTDSSVFVAVPLLLLLVAIFERLIPALRAASTDPLETF